MRVFKYVYKAFSFVEATIVCWRILVNTVKYYYGEGRGDIKEDMKAVYRGIQITSHNDHLYSHFIFSETRQGNKYWSNISNKIAEVKYGTK